MASLEIRLIKTKRKNHKSIEDFIFLFKEEIYNTENENKIKNYLRYKKINVYYKEKLILYNENIIDFIKKLKKYEYDKKENIIYFELNNKLELKFENIIKDDINLEPFFNRFILINEYIPVDNYEELLYMLEGFLEKEDTKGKYYNLRIIYKPLNNENIIRTTTEKELNNRTIEELIKEVIKMINKLEEIYNIDLYDEELDNLEGFFLQEIVPYFGNSGIKKKILIHDNETILTINFDKTYNKCLIKSVYKSLGLKEDKFYKNINIGKLTFYEQKNLLENRFKIKIIITQNEDLLLKKYKNKKNNEVLLFGSNYHVGYVTEGIFDIQKGTSKKLPKIDIKNFNDIIICTYDCEYGYDGNNQPKEPNLLCCNIFIDNKIIEKSFICFKNFLKYLKRINYLNKKTIYCFAHNARKIENIFVVKEHIRNKKYSRIEIKNSNGMAIKSYKIKYKTPIYFYDSLSYMKLKLEDLAILFKTTTIKNHKEMPKDCSNKEELNKWYLNKKWDINNKNDIDYCNNDCKILLEIIIKLNKYFINIFKNDLLSLKKDLDLNNSFVLTKSTISSFLRSIFFNKNPDLLSTEEQNSIFKSSYYGGRNECFYIGKIKGDIKTKDINSSYPYEMKKGFAGKFLRCIDKNKKKYMDDENNKKRWYSIVKLKYKKDMKFPLLAVKKNNKLLFPNIKNYNIVTIWDKEYKCIKDNLDIKKIYKIYEFDNKKIELDNLFELKNKNKGKELYYCLKTIINSIYGSFGMDSYRDVKLLTKENLNFLSDNLMKYKTFDDYNFIVYKKFNNNVPCAYQVVSSITMQARLHLWKKMNFLDSLGCKILYCDTDSIYFINNKNYEKNKFIGDKIGEWDEENLKEMNIKTCKIYSYKKENSDKIIKFKGLSKENISKGKIKNNFINKFYIVDKDFTLKNIERKINFSLKYDKGIIKKNKTVEPLII